MPTTLAAAGSRHARAFVCKAPATIAFAVVVALFSIAVVPSALRADEAGGGSSGSKKQNPTSRLYVADLDGGTSEINTGERIEDLTRKSVHSAEGTVVETRPDATSALVLSNGTGIYFAEDTRLEIKRFLQEPFQPNRTDLEAEPSISQTQTYLSRGTVGLCTSRLIAGSSMVYSTPLANISIRGQRVVVETTDSETKVSLIAGDVTVRGEGFSGGEVLKPGQQAVIRRESPNSPPQVQIRPIPDADRASLDDKVSSACMARRTVYFEIAERTAQNEENRPQLVPVIITPVNPKNNGPIISDTSVAPAPAAASGTAASTAR
ncbi:hypothetical protein Ga0100231_002450 [Opitutaceae bacterium TAV4]|nr:hypothetical protein Ga0100231_002450 [Opitutaceae bacterium TAV4]RRK01802.1 hypothetical protein Ga0100230_000585 [Opitutaceae bacterium TAV3]